jgi:peptidyl-prolyl cis-trans isomerase NIMA-interacting 1
VQDHITRTKEEALDILKGVAQWGRVRTRARDADAPRAGYERRIRTGETTLPVLARTESDCSSAAKGGDLGWFGPNAMQRA